MPGLTSSHETPASWRSRAFIICLFFIGIFFLLYFGKTKIMRVVVKHPTAFHYAMKGKSLLGKIGLPISGNDHQKTEQVELPENIEIVVNLAQSKGKYTQFWGGFGYNSFKAGSLDPTNQQLLQLMSETNRNNPGTFNYIRAFNIFTNGEAVTQYGEGCEIYSENQNGKPHFDWTVCDQVFDYIVSLGFDVIVDFTLMPIELASNKKRIQPWFGGNMSPPLSHEKWANLVYETTRHLTERYSLETVSRWYFEVWNEPDLAWLFWIPDKDNPEERLREWGDMDAYNKLYDYTVAAVKRVHEDLQVGGPVVAGSYIQPFLKHLADKNDENKQGTTADFLSFHSYGSVFSSVIKKIDEVHRIMGKIAKKDQQLPIIVSEYSPHPYRQAWYVSRYPALWFIATVDAVFAYADQNNKPNFLPRLMIYWTSPVVRDFGEHQVEKNTDGFATTLGARNTILKLPIFNAYQMLGYLSDHRVSVSSSFPFPDYHDNLENEFINLLNVVATRSDTSFETLVYRFKENDAFSQSKESHRVHLKIENIPGNDFYLKKYAIDGQNSNVFTAWRSLNSPMNPTEQQWEILDESDDLKLLEPAHKVDISAEEYEEDLILNVNQAILFVFNRQTDRIPPQSPGRLIKKQVSTNSVYLQWQPSKQAMDGDVPVGYAIYQNMVPIQRVFTNSLNINNLRDDTNYDYQIYSLDEQGNKSETPISLSLKTRRDDVSLKLIDFNIIDVTTLELKFNKILDKTSASDILNYRLDNGVEVKSVILNEVQQTIRLMTTPHQVGENYTVTIGSLRDQARQPNELKNYQRNYEFQLVFKDKLDSNSRDMYICKNIWDEGGIGQLQYDPIGKRLKLLTGDDVGERFSHNLPATNQGVFQVEFQPLKKYPEGGKLILRLKQDEGNYYQVENRNGYQPGYIKKVVQNVTVDSTSFAQEYHQGLKYEIAVKFAPGNTVVTGFPGSVIIEQNDYPIQVKQFDIELIQQDGYFDNIYYQSN